MYTQVMTKHIIATTTKELESKINQFLDIICRNDTEAIGERIAKPIKLIDIKYVTAYVASIVFSVIKYEDDEIIDNEN